MFSVPRVPSLYTLFIKSSISKLALRNFTVSFPQSIMDYQRFISERSKARQPSAIRAIMPFLDIPGMITLGAGAPNPTTFPFEAMEIKLKTGDKIQLNGTLFQEALQYSPTAGLPVLIKWLRDLQLLEHRPPREDFGLSIGTGSQDLITKAFEMFINPGDNILIENPSYTGIISFLRSQPCKLIDVKTDANGIIPNSLEDILSTWKDSATRPKVLYTIPIGSNPTGVNVTVERKREIYAIAKRFDLIIMEDDPYYYLQFGSSRTPSFFSMDEDGRVLRFDSMSKILSAGMRIGWATGPKPFIDRINMHTMTASLQPSGIPQAITFSLLQHWGYTGFFDHVDKVSNFYKDRRDVFLQCAERQLKGFAEWAVPDAGMFIWLKLLGIKDSNNLITTKCVEKKVLAVPGVAFLPTMDQTPYVRVSFSNVSEEHMDEALRRLAEALREEVESINM